jgi:hypothetical protein
MIEKGTIYRGVSGAGDGRGKRDNTCFNISKIELLLLFSLVMQMGRGQWVKLLKICQTKVPQNAPSLVRNCGWEGNSIRNVEEICSCHHDLSGRQSRCSKTSVPCNWWLQFVGSSINMYVFSLIISSSIFFFFFFSYYNQ